ncbi:MAG: hypothetical protein JNJ50_18625, partial [Acidobacteria bacterium]|nr:hypothetical protein [Acidobacteriota bacterium]
HHWQCADRDFRFCRSTFTDGHAIVDTFTDAAIRCGYHAASDQQREQLKRHFFWGIHCLDDK